MKYTAIIISIIAIIIGGFALMQKSSDSFGNSPVPIFYFGATNASSTVISSASLAVATSVSPILSVDAARTNAVVCNNSANEIFLHQQANTTTSTVVLDKGIILSPSASSTNVCREFPGFRGYLYGVSTATTSVTVSSWK